MASCSSIPTRESLLTRLKDWADQEGWKRFFDTYWRLIYATALQAGLSETEAQEVVQETVISVAKKMKVFRYDPGIGSFKGWLFRLTSWRIADQFRRRRSDHVSLDDFEARNHTDPGEIPPVLQLSNWEKHWDENLLQAALDGLKKRVSVRQYQVLDLYVLRDVAAADVARAVGISVTQVYLTKFRMMAALKKEIARIRVELI